jgi:hypothetical protein
MSIYATFKDLKQEKKKKGNKSKEKNSSYVSLTPFRLHTGKSTCSVCY